MRRTKLTHPARQPSMLFVLVLFIGTLIVFGVMAYYLNQMSSEDREEGGGLSGNQMRLLAWGGVIIVGLIGAVIEYFMVLR